jgi:hypothetical protein
MADVEIAVTKEDGKEKMTEEQKKWQAEEDIQTLQAALGIVRDEERMARVRKMAEQKRKELGEIADSEYLGTIGLGKK